MPPTASPTADGGGGRRGAESAADGGPATGIPSREDRLNAFHAELRAKNLQVLLWSAAVFNLAYLGWTLFDMVLAPDLWRRFLVYRLVAAVLNTAIALAVLHPRLRHRTWEAFWLWLFVFGVFIAPMLPVVGDNFAPYVMGFTIVVFGAGLLPFWPPSWAVTNVGAIVVAAGLAFILLPSTVPATDLIGGLFFVATGTGLTFVSARFRYQLALRDFDNRHELAAVLERETAARTRLDTVTAELQQALDRAEEVDRTKSRFFANISHELRTPLTLITAPIESLVEEIHQPEARRQIEVVRGNARRLARLIDELLDLTRLDAGHLRLDVAEVDLAGLARTVYTNSAAAAAAASIDLSFDSAATGRSVWGDAHRLETVLTNLVANALRYTPQGGSVQIRTWEDGDGASVSVVDDGPGIAPEHQERIFERFYRAVDQQAPATGGAGIGLSLARELVELHGGTLSVESRPGEGATFVVAIPFGRDHLTADVVERRQRHDPGAPRRRATDVTPAAVPTAPEAAAPAPASAPSTAQPAGPEVRPARILLAEDNLEMRNYITGLLAPPHHVQAVADGELAWQRVSEDPPDLVVSDVMMPRRSGTQLCRAMKTDPRLRTVPVILLTARVGSEATLEGYASGADDFVAKPFHPQVLRARVAAQLKLRELTFQLADQERFAAVGTLAAGILHEVRNPINAILNGARVLAAGEVDHATAAELVKVVVDGAERIQQITSALEEHARPADANGVAYCDPREGLESTLTLLGHRLTDVTVERRLDSRRLVAAVPGMLNQVFVNLVDNAVRAGATHLVLTTEDRGANVRIGVRDNGPGVPPEIAWRIFEPFFTTREPGSGSGLGLYLSRRLVEGFGGTLELVLPATGGAEMVIELPALPTFPATDDDGGPAAAAPPPA